MRTFIFGPAAYCYISCFKMIKIALVCPESKNINLKLSWWHRGWITYDDPKGTTINGAAVQDLKGCAVILGVDKKKQNQKKKKEKNRCKKEKDSGKIKYPPRGTLDSTSQTDFTFWYIFRSRVTRNVMHQFMFLSKKTCRLFIIFFCLLIFSFFLFHPVYQRWQISENECWTRVTKIWKICFTVL